MSLAHAQAAASERRAMEHGTRDPKTDETVISAASMSLIGKSETSCDASGRVSCTQVHAADRKISTCPTSLPRGTTAQTRVFANHKVSPRTLSCRRPRKR